MKDLNTLILKIISQIITLMPGFLIAIFLRLAIKQRHANGKDTVLYKNKSNKYTILALDSERYRGDLDVLAKSDKFRVLHIRQGWQMLLIQANLKGKHYIHEFKNIDKNTDLYNKHKNTQLLITNVLTKLYKIISIDCVTTVHFKYLPDYYWTMASESLNIPYIMLYRECNLMSPIIYDMVLSMMASQGVFHGSHVIVHNQKCKDVFIQSNFAKENMITIASALRMDALVNNINQDKYKNITKENKRKKFTLFYFPVDSSMFGIKNNKVDVKKYYSSSNYWDKKERFFIQLHETILKLADENRDIDFIIKPKDIFMHEKSWNFYEKVVLKSGVDVKKLDNYIVDAYADVHSLIVESDVVCVGQSSTTIESLILGKRVIFPAFFEYMDTEYFKQFPWRNHLGLFDIATDAIEFEKVFYNAMQSVEVSDHIMEKRKELYLQCFDDLTGDAIGKYTKTIINVIEQHRCN
jgi:hypothetical protein